LILGKEIKKRRSKPLADNIPRLTERDVLEHAKERLQRNLRFTADGYVCNREQLIQILLGIAATKNTLEAVCAELDTSPCAATVRSYLQEQLTVAELPKLERAMNEALAQALPPHLCLRDQELAIDYHDQAYYGKTEQAAGLWVRAEAKHGTTRVYRVATAYVIRRGLRFTLAIKFVGPADDHTAVLRFLLKRCKALHIKAKTLYLDRGFAGVKVIKYLQRTGTPSVIACPIRGKTGGVRALCVGQQSYLTEHTFSSPKHGRARAQVAICRGLTTAKRTHRKEKKMQWLVFILINCVMKAKEVRKKYRRRFGIETSYRCARQLRGWTTANNAAYRFLLIALSFFLLNVWVELRWLFARRPRRGGQLLLEGHFRLRRFVRFIIHALETLYGRVCHIQSLSKVKAYA
jgi:putative transposase